MSEELDLEVTALVSAAWEALVYCHSPMQEVLAKLATEARQAGSRQGMAWIVDVLRRNPQAWAAAEPLIREAAEAEAGEARR